MVSERHSNDFAAPRRARRSHDDRDYNPSFDLLFSGSEMSRRPARVSPPVRALEDPSLAALVVASHPLPAVTGGSALLDVDGRLLAIHDDAFRVSWIDRASFAVTPLVLLGDGTALAKPDKPDFESAVRTSDGAVHVLGSGSTAKRCIVARIELGNSVTLRQRPALYRAIQKALASAERPNIEGAIVVGERLRVFNRAAGRTPNASVDLAVAALHGREPRVLAAQPFELGTLASVRLGFTDVTALPDGRNVFLATAEDAPDAIADGPVTGSVVGVLEPTASAGARWTRLLGTDGLPSPYKVEGVVIDRDVRGGWLLTDSDDPRVPAMLLRVELRGFA
jgi:uncharacterized protein DUF6929